MSARRLSSTLSTGSTFPDSWIGRADPIHWPARSPDLTPVDYCVCDMKGPNTYDISKVTEEEVRRGSYFKLEM